MSEFNTKSVVIPVIDFKTLGLDKNECDITDEDIAVVGKQLKDAMSSIGFCYLRNHGIEKRLLEQYFAVSREFFALPMKEKKMYDIRKQLYGMFFGYITHGPDGEHLGSNQPGDLKECFNYVQPEDPNNWPPSMVEFQKVNKQLFASCALLSLRMCDALSVGLGLDKGFMRKAHTLIGKEGNMTTLRSLYYPPINQNRVVETNQKRLAEHTDYGTITLLFQYGVGGLEVKTAGQGFVPATPIPDTVVVNIGDMMQRWTSDLLISSKHKVEIPTDETQMTKERQSIAFFVMPDSEYVIECIDGSNKYKPMTPGEHLKHMYDVTY